MTTKVKKKSAKKEEDFSSSKEDKECILDDNSDMECDIGGTWFQAMQYCKLHNMDLVSVETEAENDFLYETMKLLCKDFGGDDEYRFWSSGTTFSYDKWAWMGTGQPIKYFSWMPKQPDNIKNDKCLEIRCFSFLVGGDDEYRFWSSGSTFADDKWVWMGTGLPIKYFKWMPKQPDNARDNEKCLEIRYNPHDGILWNDEYQNKDLHVVCESKIS
ncbi:unnamed protein product [Diabrotica balteata]|uniref:C-type lectin domain-containing protein n=1 Tax=Diabrotica balteata TaxID=107213 RepID=A0A9N9TGD4_DIABA|nr:unnamed protein product [Diabrotica balteata]